MMTDQQDVSRRSFLQTTGAAGLATAGMTALSYGRVLGANGRIRVGFIGAGGMGTAHLNAHKRLKKPNNLESIAVADCWKKRAEEGAARIEAKQSFTDYRKVLDIDDIDYVTIATPEHWHSQMTIEALDSGKAVYCEKPMTHTIPQGLEVMKKQKESKLPVQVGVQAMSDDSYISAAKAIEDGRVGSGRSGSDRIRPPV